MKLYLKKTSKGLIPLDEVSVNAFNKLKEDEEILVSFTRHRNIKNHRRLFSMLNGVVANSDHYNDVNSLLDVIKLKAHYFTTVVTHDGNAVYIPKSINFATLDEESFRIFFSNAIDIILEFCKEEDLNSILRYC